MKIPWKLACLAVLIVLVTGCRFTAGDDASGVAGETRQVAGEGINLRGLPASFGAGRAATASEIAALDIDVSPDGTGLPPGRGTVAEGAKVYAAQCASCHGRDGEGVSAIGNRLVGREPLGQTGWNRTIGNYWPFATSLFDYVRRSMPFDRPGSLTAAEVYAVTAYLLHLNEIIPEDAVMDGATLPRVEMPARDLFILDDRDGSTTVR